MFVKPVFNSLLKPFTTRVRGKRTSKKLKDLIDIRDGINNVNRRFLDTLINLAKVTTKFDELHVEDFSYFNTLKLKTHTVSSSKGLELINYYLGDGFSSVPKEVFKKGRIEEDDYLNWYSNLEDVEEFILGMNTLLYSFIKLNSKENTPFDSKGVMSFDQHLVNFLKEREFKYLILDYINLLVLMLEIELTKLKH